MFHVAPAMTQRPRWHELKANTLNHERRKRILVLWPLLLSIGAAGAASSAQEPTDRQSGGAATELSHVDGAVWRDSLAAGYADAARRGSLIFVRAGAVWCGPCRYLDGEIEQDFVQEELQNWTCVYIDVDKSPVDAQSMRVGAIPALRVLTKTGRLIASTEGAMSASALVDWLKTQRTEAARDGFDADQAEGAPSFAEAVRLVRQTAHRAPAVREAAIRRLVPHPRIASVIAVNVMEDGDLATRLAMLELLSVWGAPTEELDPWQPSTVTNRRIERLRDWARGPHDDFAPAQPVTTNNIDTVRDEISRLLLVDTRAEALVIRERLIRYGDVILEEVDARLDGAVSDESRERLMGLRYRVNASDRLAASWPGGIDRLASSDTRTRRAAAGELIRVATTDDSALMLDLFKDPDPIVRETSLRALHSFGGAQARGALIGLLSDPEPNVRTAVLKQMAESPAGWMIDAVTTYIEKEQDADLVVHAVRVLREVSQPESVSALIELFGHESWRVRAEAAESVGGKIGLMYGGDAETKSEAYAALLDLLSDPDGFVVARALKGLERVDLAAAVEPLFDAVERHPELAPLAIEVLSRGGNMRARAIPHLAAYVQHESPTVRAAAIEGLLRLAPDDAADELYAALTDGAKEVRIAAASALFDRLQEELPDAYDDSAPIERMTTEVSWLAEVLSVGAGSPVQAGAEAIVGDDWLAQFHAGADRPAWFDDTIEPLREMLAAEDAEERLAAVLPLNALGLPEALVVARELLAGGQTAPQQLSPLLPWLYWPDRTAMFESIAGTNHDAETLMAAIRSLAEVRDPRAADLLWRILEEEIVDSDLLSLVVDSIRRIYFGRDFFFETEIFANDRATATEAAKHQLESGSESQRFVALCILATAAQDEMPVYVKRIRDDQSATDVLRRDALQFLLAISVADQAREAAIAALSGDSELDHRIALKFLAEGRDGLDIFRGDMYISLPDRNEFVYMRSDEFTLAPPKGLDTARLIPLARSADAEIAAYAGYFLALMEDEGSDHLDRLIDHWRASARSDSNWSKMVYRAISARNDGSRADVLGRIFEELKSDTWEVREFYWTIRGMTGREVLKLRKQIRDEVGMENLQ